MAEYLAPGVYVEEIPSANKPIQAASTSTAGMVGMTERGPLNTPTLTTSLGDYARKFGGALDPLTFTDGRDGLPYAAEGFFNNGGARLYVVRIAGPAAVQSSLSLISADATVTSAASLAMGANKGAVDFILAGGAGLAANYANTLILSDGDRNQSLTLKAATPFATLAYLSGGLPIDIPKTTPATSKATVLTASAEGVLALSAAAGTAVLTLEAAPGYAANDFVLIHNAGAPDGNAEFAEVLSVNAGAKTVTLKANMTKAHAKGSAIKKVVASATTANISVAATASTEPLTLSLSAYTNITAGTPLLLEDGSGTPAGTVRVVVSDLVNKVTLNEALAESYPAGSKISAGIAMLSVHAQWPGSWGDRLRLTAGSSALVRTSLSAGANANATTINLVTAFGLFPGSVVVVGDPLAGPVQRATVVQANTATGLVTLDKPLTSAVAAGVAVASQEFSLLIERVDKVSGKVVESEFFDRLALASTHPRHALKLVGSWDAAAKRPSESGGSQLVRIQAPAASADLSLPIVTGLSRFMTGGSDDLAGVDDKAYKGVADENPVNRTGIQALENEPAINIVAVPGRTTVDVQKALVDHCEKMRYRFAAVDVPLGSSMKQAREHRQNFDSTRVAVYYPGLVISNRFGNPGDRMTITSSGHMLGVYARTDITRGVHKAPANEVIQGILALETALTKGEQDILNPINLNCHRDFRSENRGLRVYGARVATSDPEWKYINVRRLLLFIEQSLDNGLQWAVFEPNDTPLWDQVSQSISGFLNTVWRSGALEGLTQPEAFFVNIGFNVTMEQADIDNGRLIVEIGVAPVKPAEFVIVRIFQKTREATA
jgi:uncharacterized protein